MSYIGAYYRKYKYPNGADNIRRVAADDPLKPQYKVAGMEPDVADANFLDSEIADIGEKLGAFSREIDENIRNFTPEQHVRNDELIGNQVQVIGSNDSASTVEPEVRRIFGEYQTAAFLDSLSDSDESSYDESNNYNDYNEYEDNIHDVDNDIIGGDDQTPVDENNTVSLEKSYHGINYYEVDNTKQFVFDADVKANVDVNNVDNIDNIDNEVIESATITTGAGEFDWSQVLDE